MDKRRFEERLKELNQKAIQIGKSFEKPQGDMKEQRLQFDDKVLRDFGEWVKTQPIYVGRGHIDGDKEILIVREGKYENAIEVYIKERSRE